MAKAILFYPGPLHFRQAQVAAHRHILEALNLELVLADDFIDPSDREFFSDAIELPPAAEVGEALVRVERWLHTNRAHAVVAQSESGLLLGSLVALRLGVPCISPEAAHLTTNKFRCREILRDAEVAQPHFMLARDAQEVREFAREFGYPVVLKGTASALGRLVTLVASAAEVEASVERLRFGLERSGDIARLVEFGRITDVDLGCDPRTEFLVESFAVGDAIETDGVVAGMEIRNFGVTRQALSKPPYFFMEGYLSPADLALSELDAIEAQSDRALHALGVADTGFSTEMRLGRGRTSIIEVNGRLGWDEGFGDLFALSTGSQPAFQALEIALGRPSPFQRDRNVRGALAYAVCYKDKIVARVPTAEEISAVERAHSVRIGLAVHVGERIFAPPQPDATPHLAFALAHGDPTSTACYARARAAVDALRFELTSA